MSAFTWPGRIRIPPPTPARTASGKSLDWIGVDFSGEREVSHSRVWIPLLAMALAAALTVVALRIDLIRTRYALAAALGEEQTLLEEQRALVVRKRELLDPMSLSIEARRRGFGPPAHVFSLPEPDIGRDGPVESVIRVHSTDSIVTRGSRVP